MRDPFDISDETWNATFQTTKEFTDREAPQEAFERKIRVLQQSRLQKKEAYYVLNYYGIGGIGKTSFQNKLCNMMDGDKKCPCRILDKIECDYITHDFGSEYAAKDKLSILLSLRKQLKKKNRKFNFFCFDSAVVLYAQKTGINVSKDETASGLLADNKWLDFIITAIGLVPEAGWVSGVFHIVDVLQRAILKKFRATQDSNTYKDHFESLNQLQPSEILDNLHLYFITDMRENMKHHATKPIVVFLDTYEKYIETGNTDNIAIIEDHWLRKNAHSVIRSIPYLLWVIMGRERLNWTEDDDWGEVSERSLEELTDAEKDEIAQHRLEQHLMGDLSPKDADKFLEKAGISDAPLRKQLYELTSGTPLFLDLCVDTYVELCHSNRTPVIEDFGKDLTQLINRYLANLKSYNREMAYFLSAVGAWNDKTIEQIRKQMHTLRDFSVSRYKEFVKHSFVITKEDGSYYMHETFRKAALANADEEIVKEVNSVMAKLTMQELALGNSLATATQINEFITLLAENKYEYLELCDYLYAAQKAFDTLVQIGEYQLIYILAGKLAASVSRQYHGTAAELITFTEYAKALLRGGKYPEAANVFEQIDYDVKNLEIRPVDMIRFKLTLIRVYHAIGEFSFAQELAQSVYDEARTDLGENHDDTLDALVVLTEVYGASDKGAQYLNEAVKKLIELKGIHIDTMQFIYKGAKMLYQQKMHDEAEEALGMVLELQCDTYGENHPLTLKMLVLHANFMIDAGNVDDGIELLLKICETQIKILGEGHPDIWDTREQLSTAYAIKWRKTNEPEYIRLSEHLLKQIYWDQLDQLGIRHPKTVWTFGLLVTTYTEFDCPCDDEKMLEEIATFEHRLKQAQVDATFIIEEEPIEYKNLKDLFFSFAFKALDFDLPQMLKAQLEDAKAYYEDCKQEFGEKHPRTLKAMLGLAAEYISLPENTSIKNAVHGVELLIHFWEIQKELNPEKTDEFLSIQALIKVSVENQDKLNDLLLQSYRWLDAQTDKM